MAKCKKCDKDIVFEKGIKLDDYKCVICQAQFHTSCVSETLTRGAKTNWKCEVCCSNTVSGTSKLENNKDQADTLVLKAIADLRAEINTRWDENDKKLDRMQKNIDQINSEFSSFKAKLDGVEQKVSSAESKIKLLTAENSKLRDEINDLQQHTRKNNVVISGIPVLPRGANVFPLIDKIADLLQVQYYRTDINAAHWLPVRGGGRENQSILVAFVSRIVKQEWLRARRNRKSLTANEIDRNFPQNQIYINDQLTQKSREIFNAARFLVKQEKLASVWTSDGIVMARKIPRGRPFRVTSLDALTERASPPGAARPVTVPPTTDQPSALDQSRRRADDEPNKQTVSDTTGNL